MSRNYLSSGAYEFTSGFSEVCVTQSLVFCVAFCRSLFVLLSFLYCGHGISLFCIFLLISFLVFSDFSCHCIVCSSSIYASNYPLDIFKLFVCLYKFVSLILLRIRLGWYHVLDGDINKLPNNENYQIIIKNCFLGWSNPCIAPFFLSNIMIAAQSCTRGRQLVIIAVKYPNIDRWILMTFALNRMFWLGVVFLWTNLNAFNINVCTYNVVYYRAQVI